MGTIAMPFASGAASTSPPATPAAPGPAPAAPPGLSDADAWDQLTDAGVPADSATAIVKGRKSLDPGTTWDRLTDMGVDPVKSASLAAALHGVRDPYNAPSHTFMGDVGRSALQGATLGWSDELAGHALPASMGGGAQTEADMRARQAAFHKAHPWVDTGAKLVGGIGAPLAAAGALAALPEEGTLGAIGAGGEALLSGGGVAGNLARGIALGGAAGAGTSDAPTLGGKALAAVGPAALGAIFGVGTPYLTKLAGGLTAPASAAAARALAAIRASGGFTGVESALQRAQSLGRGDVSTLADLSPALRQSADYAANNSEDAYRGIADVVAGRQADATDRILQDIKSAVGDPIAQQRIEDLARDRLTWAAGPQGYGGIRSSNPTMDPGAIAPYLEHPKVQSAWQQARLAGDIKAGDPADQLFQLIANNNGKGTAVQNLITKIRAQNPATDPRQIGQWVLTQTPEGRALAATAPTERPVTFDDMLGFKTMLDGKVGEAYANGNKPLADAYSTVRGATLDALENSVPGFKAIQAQYADRMRLEDAVRLGAEAWNTQDTRLLQQQVAGMTPDQLQNFRDGMASSAITKLRSAATNVDEAKKLVQASPALQDKLKLVFGDQTTFDQFIERAKAESDLAQLRNVLTGSETARRLASKEGYDPLQAMADVAASPHGLLHPQSVPVRAIGAAIHAVSAAGNRAQATELGNMLRAQGPTEITNVLTALRTAANQPAPALQRFLPTVAAAAAPAATTAIMPPRTGP